MRSFGADNASAWNEYTAHLRSERSKKEASNLGKESTANNQSDFAANARDDLTTPAAKLRTAKDGPAPMSGVEYAGTASKKVS